MKIFKRILFGMINFTILRKQVIRISSALMNKALNNNNNDMKTNGELFLLSQILSFQTETDHEFVVFDVGANVGQWTFSLLNIAEAMGIIDGLTIHCFEPSLSAFSHLQGALAKHRMVERIHAINFGLSNTPGNGQLWIEEESSGINTLYKRRLEGLDISYERSETVQMTTVDNYCLEKSISHIDFLKIDTEGHELAVVQGATNMLRKEAIGYIQFEYGGTWIDSRTLFVDMYDFITSFGLVIGKIMPREIEFYENYDQRLETFQLSNFLACDSSRINHFKRIKPCLI